MSLELWEDCADGSTQQVLESVVTVVCASCAKELTVEDVAEHELCEARLVQEGDAA